MTVKLFQFFMFVVQDPGGRRAKQEVSQLAMPHNRFSIQPCFAAPLL